MRINQIRCDRCGKVLDKYVTVQAFTVTNSPGYDRKWEYELCLICYYHIDKVIKGGVDGDH